MVTGIQFRRKDRMDQDLCPQSTYSSCLFPFRDLRPSILGLLTKVLEDRPELPWRDGTETPTSSLPSDTHLSRPVCAGTERCDAQRLFTCAQQVRIHSDDRQAAPPKGRILPHAEPRPERHSRLCPHTGAAPTGRQTGGKGRVGLP